MAQISNLYRLQLIDTQLDATTTKLSNVEKALSDNSELTKAEQNVALAEQNLLAIKKKLKDAENKSYDTRIKIEIDDASLYGGKIHNPKELQDLQNEIASLKRIMIALEDKQLEAMMEVEEAETILVKSNDVLHEIQKSQIQNNAQLNGEKTNLKNQIERLLAERNAALATIPAPDIGLYEQLRKSRNGVAVAKITSKSCTACGATLTAALVQTTQSTGQLVRCPTCGRILYPG
jgi:predicted  nucleic acid-binding Zn-ribbon protein